MTQKQQAGRSFKIAILPGDGIGPEVIAEAEKVLNAVSDLYQIKVSTEKALIGGVAIEKTGSPLPDNTLALCKSADAILFGAVGDPRFDDPRGKVRPEQALLAMRKELGVFANLRPVWVHPNLVSASPLKADIVAGVDLMVVRELTGGLYFGEPRVEGTERALDTMVYTKPEVERIAHVAFRLAKGRRSKVTSVDKANVLASSRLWRHTVVDVAKQYPEISLEHLLVDAMSMHLLRRPRDFDVILTENLFGDILSDESSMLAGSMGMLPSASVGEGSIGLYEPIHGSATDIAGRGIANPIAAILCVAMMLRHSFHLSDAAGAVEKAVYDVLSAGHRTIDIREAQGTWQKTAEIGDLVAHRLKNSGAEAA